ncbi:MAG: hypothetical protein B6D64_10050 [Bacteroidetes bacterium 4484_276]|nr:MAG: hypothetical protein B6D64_10050 [Bacteroidetes bacterium 4484_276]
MNTSNRVNQLKKSAIHEMTRLSKQYDDVAFLSWAKPTTGTPKNINDAVIEAINKGLTGGYSQSEGLPELREEIVKKLKRDNNIDANISQIIVTVGAIEGLAASVLAAIDPGDEVILPTPTYSTHITQVKLASGIPVLVPLKEEENFALDIEAIKKAITSKTKAIIFCTPSNPTGTVFPESTLEEIIAQIKKAHIPLAICAPVASQYAAIEALKGSQGCIEEFRLHYLNARDLMCERLDMLDSVFEYNKPEGSYLMFPKILGSRGNDSIAFSKNLLKQARVSTTPGIAFGPTGENHIRLSFCVPEEMINKAFDRMEKYFRNNK